MHDDFAQSAINSPKPRVRHRRRRGSTTYFNPLAWKGQLGVSDALAPTFLIVCVGCGVLAIGWWCGVLRWECGCCSPVGYHSTSVYKHLFSCCQYQIHFNAVCRP